MIIAHRYAGRFGGVPVTFLETLKIGLRALYVNKMRSMLTVLGIIVGVAAVVCMVSVGSGDTRGSFRKASHARRQSTLD